MHERDPKTEIDVWNALLLKRKRDYIREGLSEDEADEKATASVLKEIREAK